MEKVKKDFETWASGAGLNLDPASARSGGAHYGERTTQACWEYWLQCSIDDAFKEDRAKRAMEVFGIDIEGPLPDNAFEDL